MGLFNRNENSNNNYTDLSGMNYSNGYQQNGYGQQQYGYGQQAAYQQPMQNYGRGNTLSLSEYMSKVFMQMFIGLAITFGIGLLLMSVFIGRPFCRFLCPMAHCSVCSARCHGRNWR